MDTKKGMDLTKQAPRSPHAVVGGFKILGRTIDKCRAALFGNVGDYNFDCPLDNQLFSFMGIKGADFKAFVAEGHTDDKIVAWVKEHGTKKTEVEMTEWNKKVSENNYSEAPENKAWLEGEATKLGMPKDTTLFDWLDKDDKVSFKDCKECKECTCADSKDGVKCDCKGEKGCACGDKKGGEDCEKSETCQV